MSAAATLLIVVGISFYAYRQSAPPTAEPELERWQPAGTELQRAAEPSNELAQHGPLPDREPVDRTTAGARGEGATASIAAPAPSAAERSPERSTRAKRQRQAGKSPPVTQGLTGVGSGKGARQYADKRFDGNANRGTRGLWNVRPGAAKAPEQAAPRSQEDGQTLGGAAGAGRRKKARARPPAPPNDEAVKLAEQVGEASRRRSRSSRGFDSASGARPEQKLRSTRPKEAREEVALGDKLAAKGDCSAALRHYARALRADPDARSAAEPGVKRCLRELRQKGDLELRHARKRYPSLGRFMSPTRSSSGKAKKGSRGKAKETAK
jgi:hypothetical protein